MTVTDQPDQELTPEQEQHVRRLLADARHTEPAPDGVVARLDKVLAGLADEPARSADVVHLAHRRRRAATLLVAAAAVVVIGVGIGQVLPEGGGEDSADAQHPAAGAELEEESGEGAPAQPDRANGSETAAEQRSYRVSTQRFARDAASLRVLVPAAAFDSDEYADELNGAGPTLSSGRRGVCEPGAWGRGRFVPVVYDKAPGWLVLRKPQGDSQVADLFLCGSEVVVRSVTLPYP